MSNHFTHLHLHSEYSLLDGAINLDRLINFGKEQNFKALAITDHGNIFGAVKFFEKCKKANIKPILGIETYFTEDASIKSAEKKYYHLILLVQNKVGYKNLCKLISYSFQQGFYFKPRMDYAILEKYSEGLIATSACLGGHIPQLLKHNNLQEADTRMDWFLNTFGPERFYLEIQPEDQQEQGVLNRQLYEWSSKKNIPLLATGDCHYVNADDRQAHEVMLSIQTQNKLSDPDRFTFGDCRVHMRTQDEMLTLFKEHPDAVWNSGRIADMCDFSFETGKLFFPKFEIPVEHTQESYFSQLCTQGLDELSAQDRIPQEQLEEYRARLQLEVELITRMGFIGYFLVVSDFIRWAKRNGIPVGPGRGSAAGSLVAWALEITNIDPLKYNLLFERFLNPERITMPDIDIDFCIEGRERVIQQVRDKYGHDKVCQIITFGTMMAKGVVKDVARVLGIPFEDSNMITGLIPDQLKITLKEAIDQEPRLKELIESNPKVAQLFDLAFRLEGLTRHASKHAAGIVISPEPIDEVLPVYVPPKSNELVTQYAMVELESLGFLKMDLLGLKNLTLIDKALRLIEKNHAVQLNIDKLPLADAKTFELLCAGNTSGVFQLESDGLKDVLRKLQPDKFEDIIAVNALYRPGPLGSGMVDDYIARRHGKQKVEYLFPELRPVLEETYGVIVYQEQVMKIASAIAGYSLGESDILRRAMGKKKADEMAKQRVIFIEKAKARHFDEKKSGDLFDLMAYFAGYGFNKSHSAAYALIAYQTAYLKANFPAEFMACLITLEASDTDKMVFYLQEAKDMGLEILQPDIARSMTDFTVVQGKLLFGLQGIKNVGLTAVENIIAEREKKPFLDLFDFCKRVDLRTSNKRVIEHLIWAGAFDNLPGNRAQKTEELQKIIELATTHKKEAATGQMGLFGAVENKTAQDELYAYQPLAAWDDKTKLEKEREVVGFYLSAHPLDSYRQQLKWLGIPTFAESLNAAQTATGTQEPVVMGCGLIKNSKVILTKKGDRMAFVNLEDGVSKAEIVLFPKTFQKVEHLLAQHHVFVVRGALDLASPHLCKIKANDFVPMELFFEQWPSFSKICLQLPAVFEESLLHEVQAKLPKGKIPLSFQLSENSKRVEIITRQKVGFDLELLRTLEKLRLGIRISS
jgi:DNA polymerase-3 subunit alpha